MSTLQTTNLKNPSSASNNIVLDSSGRVGVGTATVDQLLHLKAANPVLEVEGTAATSGDTGIHLKANANEWFVRADNSTGTNTFSIKSGSPTSSTHRFLINSSGQCGIGTSSPGTRLTLSQSISTTFGNAGTYLGVGDVENGSGSYRLIGFGYKASSGNEYPAVIGYTETDNGGNTKGALVFGTRDVTTNTAPTERMRIGSDGNVFFGKTVTTSATVGIAFQSSIGYGGFTRSGGAALGINRMTNDGELIAFLQDDTQEGSISVSGTTVSYNGAHLSRWSQLPSGVERTEILRGSILSNIDEMCEWSDEENEQLNRMKVSDVEGDKNVSGVFQAWDDDDDTYINDFYCAMTGDFIIRIAGDVTVERGDLLMSAGDGTAKPQDDDIIRSKTIAKVTSTNVSCTHEDGSYCVPCVLMAC